jgi:hypothetical protein
MMDGFAIPLLCGTLAQAITADGGNISSDRIRCLLSAAAVENGRVAECDVLPVLTMFLIFADFSDRIGRELGHAVDPEGFALDWAGDYPQFCDTCMNVQRTVVEAMGAASKAFREVQGYSPGEVLVRAVNDNVAPEVAAAQFERERQVHTLQ